MRDQVDDYFHQMHVPIVSTLEEISTTADYHVNSNTKSKWDAQANQIIGLHSILHSTNMVLWGSSIQSVSNYKDVLWM